MRRVPSRSLRATSPLRVLDGFGRAVRAACRTVSPGTEEELLSILQLARSEGLSVAFRGAGRSYGDAAMNREGLVIDLRGLAGMLDWSPAEGIAEARGGLTIEGLWRRTIEDGYWPAVVPGTMFPTLAGCVSMNIHGKNNFAVGPFGDHVLELDLVTARGEKLTVSRTAQPDVFHAAVGGLGMLGAITRVKLKLKKVSSGRLRVEPIVAPDLDGMFDAFEARLPHADYLVGWLDCFPRGAGLGRGVIHQASYLQPGEDPLAEETLHVERQGLPARILGFPRDRIWQLMKPWWHHSGLRLVNWAKYASAVLGPKTPYFQSHVAFAFLLDYVPNWRLAYGPGGFIQIQIFVPHATARETFREVLRLAHDHGEPSYLGVMKRHRADPFLLTHGLDGWSLAMDHRITPANRDRIWALAHAIHARVIAGGGRFYFAKDAVLTSADAAAAFGPDRLEQFRAIKKRLDPDDLLASDLFRRGRAPGTAPPGGADRLAR
jgi:decaprenylphospho-beta-D-ribofuranose 2-oxidase